MAILSTSFDKGYNDYKAFGLFSEKGAGFVTRIKDNAVYKLEEEFYIEECIHSGVLEDTIIEVTVKKTMAVKAGLSCAEFCFMTVT